MKVRKTYIVLIAIACSLVVIAGAITAAVFIVRGNRQRESEQRVEAYMAELSAYSPDTAEVRFGLDFGLYGYAEYRGFGSEPLDVYERLDGADAAMGIDFFFALEDESPVMKMSLRDEIMDLGSVYLHNGKVYVCPYMTGWDFAFNEGEKIVQIIDAQEMFGDIDWSQLESGNWQGLSPALADIEELLGMLGLEDSEELDKIFSVAENPETLFTDARKEETDGQARYIFDLDTGYFAEYFDGLEAELDAEYNASYGDRSVSIYILPQGNTLRLTLALKEDVTVGKSKQTLVTALDFSLNFDADTPYFVSDIFVTEDYAEGVLVSNRDCMNEKLPSVEGAPSGSGALLGYFRTDSNEDFSIDYGYVGEDMLAFFNGNKLYVYSTDGCRVRTLEYRYEVVDFFSNGEYLTVVLGNPFLESYYDYQYLFNNGFISNGNNYKCLTYDITDFSLVSEVYLPTDAENNDAEKDIIISCMCGNTSVLGGDGWFYFIDVTDGSYVYYDDFYTLTGYCYCDSAENKVWLSDCYLGGAVVDLDDYTYTFTSVLPHKEKYEEKQVEAEGYAYVNCFAGWQGYEVAIARSADYSATYLALYDAAEERIVGTVELDYFYNNSQIVTADGKFVWWDYSHTVMDIIDLAAMTGGSGSV